MGASRAPREANTKRQTKKGVPGAEARREPRANKQEEDPPGIPPWDSTGGSSDVVCGGVLLSHTLSSAVPSPRPGLSFRVRKGTGRLTWAMTTAKPIHSANPPGDRPATEPATIPIVAVREPDNGREAKRLTNHHRRDHKKTMLPAIQREKPPQDETQPTKQGKGWKVCRVRPLVPVGSTPHKASTSGLSNTCSTCGLQTLPKERQGILILEQASRLDAFSGYPSRT